MTTSSPVRARWSRTLSASFVVGAMAMLGAQGTAPAPTPASTPATPASPRSAARGRAVEARGRAERAPSLAGLAQQMNDQVFSYGELAFQEVETSKYLTGVLEQHGFRIERNYAGIPTAWVATWGSGKPVIALGSDIDCIPQASQKPGVAYRDPVVPGAPGHGEGHNSGVPLNIVAALAVKKIMEREHLPGHAEDLAGRGRGGRRRQGVLRPRRAVQGRRHLAVHARGQQPRHRLGRGPGTGLQSVEYTFKGEAAHAAVESLAWPLGAGRRAS